jgi:hypothetical protein
MNNQLLHDFYSRTQQGGAAYRLLRKRDDSSSYGFGIYCAELLKMFWPDALRVGPVVGTVRRQDIRRHVKGNYTKFLIYVVQYVHYAAVLL